MADEASRLLEALTGSPGSMAVPDPEPETPSSQSAHSDEQSDHGDHTCPSTCTWCPVCRVVDAVRSTSPETLLRFADLARFAAGVLEEAATRHTAADGTRGDNAPSEEEKPS